MGITLNYSESLTGVMETLEFNEDQTRPIQPEKDRLALRRSHNASALDPITIKFTDDSSFAPLFIDRRFVSLANAIKDSRYIISLPDNWDDESSPSIDKLVWRKAAVFLIDHAAFIWETFRMLLPPPKISPGPAGSVDIYWDETEYYLLANVSASRLGTFYGEHRATASNVKGKFDPQSPNMLLFPLLIERDV